MKHKIYLFSFGVLVFSSAYAQPQFTQQMFNRMNINPAFTGLKNTAAPDTCDTKQLDIVGRSFTAFNDESSIMASYQMPFGKKKKSGIGFMFNFNNENYIPDYFGPFGYEDIREGAPTKLYNQFAAKIYYSNALAPDFYIGASAGMVDLTMYNNYPIGWAGPNAFPPQNYIAPDFDFGWSYNWKSLFFGMSFGNINNPHYDVNKDYMPNYAGATINFTIGGNINLWKTRLVLMGSLYNYNVAGSLLFYPEKHLFIGTSFTSLTADYPADFGAIGGGLYYTSFMLGCDFFKSRLKISFSLDILPSDYYSIYPKSIPNTESWMGYTFK